MTITWFRLSQIASEILSDAQYYDCNVLYKLHGQCLDLLGKLDHNTTITSCLVVDLGYTDLAIDIFGA